MNEMPPPAEPKFVPPSPGSMKPRKPVVKDRFLVNAKELAVADFNKNRELGTPPLQMDEIYITGFNKHLNGWSARLSSPLARGLVWHITYNDHKNESYVECYQKIRNERVDHR